MARLCTIAAALLATLSLTSPASQAARAQSLAPKIVVIVHPSAGVGSLSRDRLAALFSMSQRFWSNGRRVVPLNYPARRPLRVALDRAVLSMDPDQVARYWIDRRVRGQGTAPRTVSDPRLMARIVARLPGALGYVPQGVDTSGALSVANVVDGEVQPTGATP